MILRKLEGNINKASIKRKKLLKLKEIKGLIQRFNYLPCIDKYD